MKTIKQIINEELLAEAIKINDGKQALDLILNKKLGVKVHPSYFNDNSYISKDDLINSFNKIMGLVNPNDKVFAIQLAVNKIPAHQLLKVFSDSRNTKDSFKEIVSCRNKSWAKEIPGYKEIIDFNNKEAFNTFKWDNISRELKEESDKHGKHNKGSGETKDVKTLYDDGKWTLQTPTSWEGAKAISFYGKDKKPCNWCTRANLNYYNSYTENNTKPLFIIKDIENGKAYQLSVGNNQINFLDQNDAKGDEITRGDLNKIPDKLLEKISWGGRNLKDFNELKNKASKGKVQEGKYFKDPTQKIENARWSKPIKVADNISKKTWLNYSQGNSENELGPNKSMTDYMMKGKTPKDEEYLKHNGSYAEAYYYNSLPNIFILFSRYKRRDVIADIYKKNGNYYKRIGDKEDLKYSDEGERILRIFKVTGLDFDKLLNTASKDFGITSYKERENKFKEEKKKLDDTQIKHFNKVDMNILMKLQKPLNDYLNSKNLPIIITLENKYIRTDHGAFLPKSLDMVIRSKKDINKEIGTLPLSIINKSLKYKLDAQYLNPETLLNIADFINVDNNKIKEIVNGIISEFNKNIISYSKEMIKDSTGKKIRNFERRTDPYEPNNLHFEEFNYFNY